MSLFVRATSLETTKQEIADHFLRYGQVISIERKGEGWEVIYEDERDAEDAKKDLGGSFVNLNSDVVMVPESNIVIVSELNLSPEATEQDVGDYFSRYGRITSIELEKEWIIIYDDERDAEDARKSLGLLGVGADSNVVMVSESNLSLETTAYDYFSRYGRIISIEQNEEGWKVVYEDERDAEDARESLSQTV